MYDRNLHFEFGVDDIMEENETEGKSVLQKKSVDMKSNCLYLYPFLIPDTNT